VALLFIFAALPVSTIGVAQGSRCAALCKRCFYVAAKVMAAFAFTVVLYCFMSLSFTFVFDGVKAAMFAGKNHRMISINSRN
jgi:hypothetical protein